MGLFRSIVRKRLWPCGTALLLICGRSCKSANLHVLADVQSPQAEFSALQRSPRRCMTMKQPSRPTAQSSAAQGMDGASQEDMVTFLAPGRSRRLGERISPYSLCDTRCEGASTFGDTISTCKAAAQRISTAGSAAVHSSDPCPAKPNLHPNLYESHRQVHRSKHLLDPLHVVSPRCLSLSNL